MQENITTYSSNKDSLNTSIKKLYQYRSLIWVFAKRDLKVKYAQTYFGFGWSVFKPLLGLFIYVFFFGFILNWSNQKIPYAIYVLSGLIGWNLFSYIVVNGISAVHESSDLINKIYFPKSILPLSKTLLGLVETLISFVLLLPLLFYYDINLSWKILFLPLVLFYNIICGLAVSFIIAGFSIKKRDLLQVLPFLIHIAIWFTPVFLSPDIFPKQLQFIFKFNPVANVVELWRWMLFTDVAFESIWLLTFSITLILVLTGFYFYSNRENKFADYL